MMKILNGLCLASFSVLYAAAEAELGEPNTARVVRANVAQTPIEFDKYDVVARLTEGMDSSQLNIIIDVFTMVVSPLYTKNFTRTCEALITSEMKGSERSTLNTAVEKVDPSRYTQDFTRTCRALMTEEMEIYNYCSVITTVATIDPSRYTQDFTRTCRALMTEEIKIYNYCEVITTVATIDPSFYEDFVRACRDLMTEGMDSYRRCKVMKAVTKVDPSSYTDFIRTCQALMTKGMDSSERREVMEAIAKVNPSSYTAFIRTCQALTTEEMESDERIDVITTIAKVDPSCYTQAFINTCRALITEGFDICERNDLIQAAAVLPKLLWPFMVNFRQLNPTFFNYVPVHSFRATLQRESQRSPLTQESLQTILNNLHREYFNRAPTGTPQGLAFEIHNFSNQQVQTATGVSQRFNDAVLSKVLQLLNGTPPMSYADANIFMQRALDELNAEDKTHTDRGEKTHYSDTVTQEVFDWAIQCVGHSETDTVALTAVVTYLISKADNAFKIWFISFMDESKNAYNGSRTGNTDSCVKGVKERVITSLRNTHDQAFEDLFRQAEEALMLKKKMAALNDMALWAKRLLNTGVRTTTPIAEAKQAYLRAMEVFFKDVRNPTTNQQIHDAITEMMDVFDDSVTTVAGRDTKEKGMWISKIVPELQKLEVALSIADERAAG